MARAFILVIDSFGIGEAPDAASFGDVGADTFGHIAEKYPLKIPNLLGLGLGEAYRISTGHYPAGMKDMPPINAAYGAAAEQSRGKDTPSGHWEMAGLPVDFDWGYFPDENPCFPKELTDALIDQGNLAGILGNRHASGTQIIQEWGETHIKTAKPICYSSADSVFQIAAHEDVFGLQRLYDLCALAETLCKPYKIGRVIARPFLGSHADDFKRTANRKDLTVPPHGETLLDRLCAAGGSVISVGKIADIFAGRGISKRLKAPTTEGLMDHAINQLKTAPDESLTFVNFVDFDQLYGHRRDVEGYARELEKLDAILPDFIHQMRPDDLAVISADHGCDPTWHGTNHTRENVPLLFFGAGVIPQNLGLRSSFADLGQTLAAHLGIPALQYGIKCF